MGARAAALGAALLLAVAISSAQEICIGPLVRITLTTTTAPAAAQQPSSTVHYYGVLASFGWKPDQQQDREQQKQFLSTPGPLAQAAPPDGCALPGGGLSSLSAAAEVLLMERGNCSFVDKAGNAQAVGAAAVLLYDNKPGCVTMGYDNASAAAAAAVTIPLVSVTQATGKRLAALLAAAAASDAAGRTAQQEPPASVVMVTALELVDPPVFDASEALILFVAVATVIGGALWSAHDAARGKATRSQHQHGAGGSSSQAAAEEVSAVDLTPGAAVGFVAAASATLVLLFFFLDKAVFYVLMVLFCISATQGLGLLFIAAVYLAAPRLHGRTTTLPLFGAVPLTGVVAFPAALAVAVTWAVLRNASFSWVLQDLLGVSVMLMVMRMLRLPDMRVACVLLSLCFLYDVFFVFIQPRLFGTESVMVAVATGGSSHEYLPMLIRIPRLSSPMPGGYSMLGFGDVILPGFLVAYTRRLDQDLRLPLLLLRGGGGGGVGGGGYFLPTVLGYAAGLCFTYVALALSWGGDSGQPALLYLVPCTLGLVLLLGWWRGDLPLMFGAVATKWQRLRDSDHDSDAEAPAEAASAAAGGPVDASMVTTAAFGHYVNERSMPLAAAGPSLRARPDGGLLP